MQGAETVNAFIKSVCNSIYMLSKGKGHSNITLFFLKEGLEVTKARCELWGILLDENPTTLNPCAVFVKSCCYSPPVKRRIVPSYLGVNDAMEKYVRSKYLLKNNSLTYPKCYFFDAYTINLDYMFPN